MNIIITSLLIFSLLSGGLSLSGNPKVIDGNNVEPVTVVPPTTDAVITTVPPSTSAAVTTAPPATTTFTITVPHTTTTASNTTKAPDTPSPTADVTMNVTWSFDDGANVTSVRMTVTNLQAREWAAVGLNPEQQMGGAHVFICKRLANDAVVVGRYINPDGHKSPVPAGSEQGGTMTPIQNVFLDGAVICQFNLSNFTSGPSDGVSAVQPLSQSAKYHPIFAVGMLDSNNIPQKHAKDSRTAQSAFVQLNQDEVVLYKIQPPAEDNSERYLHAHGVIMVFTWILLASTGALIARYFKLTWAGPLICGHEAWFAAHRFLMSLVAILAVLGFLFILVLLEGSWVDKGPTRAFAHSIVGILVICLAFFQPFIALFRCERNSPNRFIFNYIHGIVGVVTFVLSNTALFLATYFRMFKTNAPRIIMSIWLVWVVLIVLAFELLQYYIRKKYGEISYTNINFSNNTIGEITESPTTPRGTPSRLVAEKSTTPEDKIKNILLAVHVLLATILSAVLTNHIING